MTDKQKYLFLGLRIQQDFRKQMSKSQHRGVMSGA